MGDYSMTQAFEPTQEQRELVNLLASMGVTQEDISKVVKIGERTLRKYFHEELATATIKANAKVAGALFRMATDPKGGMKAVTAQIFWLKTRARWRETANLEVSGVDGAAFQLEVNFVEGHKNPN
jgi:hypothetical protein